MSATELQTEWQGWSDRLWDAMEARFGYPGLAHLEQLMHRSGKEKRCCRCGDRGEFLQTGGGLVPSVKAYYFCADCHQWNQQK